MPHGPAHATRKFPCILAAGPGYPLKLLNEEPTRADGRLLSLDTYRGLVLLLLCLEAPNWDWHHKLAHAYPENGFVQWIAHHTGHIEWAGCVLWDLIQPSFMFMVGVSMAYSYGKRRALGHRFGKMFGHALVRSLALILLGVFLRSNGADQTYWTFEDVITQIGLGYVFLFLLWDRGLVVQISAAAGLLIAWWAWFALSAVPADLSTVQPAGWAHNASGFFSHWNLNADPGHRFDTWFLNLFPRDEPFLFHPDGYNTLNFIPSLALMIFGLAAGEFLRDADFPPAQKALILALVGIASLLDALLCDWLGICPIIKKTWTSAFTSFSGGWCLLILAGLYYLIDVRRIRRWTYPIVVVGMNSIALYVMLWLIPGWINATLMTHLGEHYAGFFGEGFEPLLQNLATMFVLWLICWWMFRNKIFLRI